MPKSTVIPVLDVEDVPAAIDWLCDRFGFTERWRAGLDVAPEEWGGTTA